MIPIKDTIRARTFPIVTWVLIVANFLIFLFESRLPEAQLLRFIDTFGLVPAFLEVTNPASWYTLVTHMFLHGGWFHLLSNVWILFIFGDNVEDRMGSGRFILFYLLGGIAAGMVQTFIDPNTTIPSVGASGAIAAVMGTYILLYPAARVLTLVPVFFIPWFIEVPAIIYLGVWFISQLYSGVLSLSLPASEWGGVAWWAHIGGFIFGLIVGGLFTARRQAPRWYPDEYYPY